MDRNAEHVSIENLTRRHLPDAVEVIAQAYTHHPLAKQVFLGLEDETRLRRVRRVYRGVMEMALQRGRVFVVRRAGLMAGAAVAYPPHCGKPSLLDRALAGAGALTVGPAASMNYLAYEREIRAMRPTKPHWYLFFLGVTPSFAGDGIGPAFVRHVCRLADADGVACYLETTVDAQVEFYKSYGFELQQSKTLSFLGGMVVNGMLRKPAA